MSPPPAKDATQDRMTQAPDAPPRSYSILRNSLYNLGGWLVPIAVNFVSIPIIVHRLGFDAYGVWTLVMAVMGYFALLDLGVVKGGIRYLAEFNAKGDTKRANEIISLGLFTYLCIGLVGGLLIYALTDPLLLPLIKLPDELRPLARQVLHLAALGFVVTMLQTYLLSLPQALHRFDISNKVDSAFQVLNTLATLAALSLGYGLFSVIVLRVASTSLCCATLMLTLKRCLPSLRLCLRFDWPLARRMFSYSLTSFVGRLGSTAATQLQVFVIGSLLGTAAVTVFSIPFQLISRVMGISSRLSMVIFPISSELGDGEGLARLHQIYLDMTRSIFFLNVGQIVLFVLFSWDLLALWMGSAFADQAGLILAVLAVGFFFDATTNLPSQVCDGLSHPKVTSTFAFLRGAVGIVFALLGGTLAGVLGVAAGFMLSCVIMALAFNLYVHARVIKLPLGTVLRSSCAESGLFGLAVLALALPFTLLRTHADFDLAAFLLKGCLVGLAFGLFGWLRILAPDQRLRLRARLKGLLPSGGRAG